MSEDLVDKARFASGLLSERWFNNPIPWDLGASAEELYGKMHEKDFLLMTLFREEKVKQVFKLRENLNHEAESLLQGWNPVSYDAAKDIMDSFAVAAPELVHCEVGDGDIGGLQECFNFALQTVGLYSAALFEIGWYPIDGEPFLYCAHAYLFDPRLAPYIDIILAQEMEAVFDSVLDEFCVAFPHRATSFQRIHESILEHRYEEAILQLFAQIDGCAFEEFNCSPFTKSKNIPRIVVSLKDKFKEDTPFYEKFFLLYQVSGLFKNYDPDSNNEIVCLNRHGVMHGLQLGYGTKVNCMKLMSFADYMLHAIKKARTSGLGVTSVEKEDNL